MIQQSKLRTAFHQWRTRRDRREAYRGPAVKERELFDEIALFLARPLPRRQALKLSGLAIAAVLLSRLGIKPAFAQSGCFCDGSPLRPGEACCGSASYRVDLYCCTSTGLQLKNPIRDLSTCPDRAPNPAHVPSANPAGCGADVFGVALPNSFLGVDFLPCCADHARCYDTCYAPQAGPDFSRKKADCDTEIGRCLTARCQAAFPRADQQDSLASCQASARLYQRAASTFGGSAYASGQARACDCCAGDSPCCPDDHTICNGVCCILGQQCVNGRCTTPCDPPRILCGDICVDPQTDRTNCGACGEICPPTAPYCFAGKCSPCSSTDVKPCGLFCTPVDYQCCGSDALSPAVGCPPGARCCSGGPGRGNFCIAADSQCCNSNPAKAISVCPAGQHCCENQCFPFTWSCCGPDGNACPPNSTCCNGACCSSFECCGVGGQCWPKNSQFC